MNRINQVITIDKQACSVRAKEIFGKISGLDHKSGGKFQRMKKDGDEIRALVEERIDAKVIYSYYEDFSFDGKVVTIDGVEFSCNAFEQLDKSKIKGVYLYMLTAGDFYLEDEPILRQVYADLWGTAFTDAAREAFELLMKKSGYLSASFGPGFYGMPVDTMQNLQLLADGRQIGIEVRGSSILVPLKSCGGIFFVSHEEIEKPSKECEECRGTIISCNLCSVRQEKRKVFKCTGVCSKCGRCKDSAMIAGANKRKTKLLALPSDFVPETDEPGYGIAFDIGTTTVVGMLWDIKNGKELGAKAMTNPQNKYGLDVISRITFGNEDKTNLVTMRTEIVACLNDIIDELCQSSGIEKEGIIRATVGGNTTMSHLFAGYDPATLAKAPFAPAYTGTLMMTGESSMLKIHPKGDVMLFPNIAGHVGGDITAGIIASRLFDEKELTLFIDIGTNGEIALTDQGRTLACSTAAGPAFEGAAIHQGMRAAPGAIEKLTITDEDVFFTTIDGVRPVGICGSGLIDAISELWSYGLIKKTGRLLSKEELEKKKPETKIAERLREGSSGREFVLIFKEDEEDIVITQNDIREVQLAKGAISAGITIMLEKLEKTEQDIHKIIVAGAFGNFINKESAVNMGLLPKVSLDRIYSAGNTAGAGTLMALASSKEALLAKKVPELVEHVELSSCEDFQTKYLTAMAFV